MNHYADFENWLSRYYPDLAAQSIEESDTEALLLAIRHYYQDSIGESLTEALPGLSEPIR